MNPDALAPIVHQAERPTRAGWAWCFLHPAQVTEMADAVLRLQDAERRLAEIADLVPGALVAWACHHRGDVRDALREVERLANGD